MIPANMMLFQIQSQVHGNLCLGVDLNDPYGQLIVKEPKLDDTSQQWIMVYVQIEPYNSLVMYNPANQLFAAPSSLTVGAPVMGCSISGAQFSAANTWNISGQAIRNAANNGLNLNVEGGSNWKPNTPVIVWSWDVPPGPNELWKLVAIPNFGDGAETKAKQPKTVVAV